MASKAELLEHIANLEAYVQKLEDSIYLESLKPRPVSILPLLKNPYYPYPAGPYPYTITHDNHSLG